MIASIHKPDISTLVTRGHFYFGWTQGIIVVDTGSEAALGYFPPKNRPPSAPSEHRRFQIAEQLLQTPVPSSWHVFQINSYMAARLGGKAGASKIHRRKLLHDEFARESRRN